ncbi:MAG: hypothetical protein ACJ74U_16770 [Jatrophihabitantaceae bacterium]
MTASAVAVEPDAAAPRARWRPDLAGHLAFAGCALATVLYLLHLGRHTSFFYDEWSWIQSRRGWRPANFLLGHNGHFVAVPVLVYHLLFATAGLRAYLPYRLVLLACHVGTCFLLYRYARLRLGPLVAVLPAGLMLMLGAAYQNLLWPFQITFIGALAFGLAGYLALDAEPTRRREVVGCLCLTAAIGCSGIGLAMLAGALVRVVLRKQWRRWWVVAVPAVVFLAWYLRYGDSGPGAPRPGGTASQLWRYLRGSYQSSVGGLTGHSVVQDRALAAWLGALILLLVVLRLAVEARRRAVPVDLLAAIALGVVLWGLTALTRARLADFGASRYLYPGAIAVLLGAIEALRDIRLPRLAVALLAVATAASVWTGLAQLRLGARSLTAVDTYARADFAALEHSKPDSGYLPNRRLLPVVTAGGYLSAIRGLGSPAMPFDQLPSQPPGARNDADRVLRQAGNLQRAPAGPQPTGGTVLTVGAGVPTDLSVIAGCQLVRPSAPAGPVALRLQLPAAGITFSSPAAIRLRARRFGPTLATYGQLPAGQVTLLRPLPDGVPVPWLIQLSSSAPVRLCGGG